MSNHTVPLATRVTHELGNLIIRAAKEAKITKSEWVRYACQSALDHPSFPDRVGLRMLAKEVKKWRSKIHTIELSARRLGGDIDDESRPKP